ncbi:MAG: cytochrome-c peroxidase [Bacteroidetes bacterium]|nr:cytochrome-c peroxidase [Bacteroidota bacterium]
MQQKLSFILLISLLVLSACSKDPKQTIDEQLTEILHAASETGSLDYFKLPQGDDYSAIPQDARNPITQEKVNLGAMLYHETGLAMSPMHTESEQQYSCASCHFASAGFQAGRHQGIADGGIGFGTNGEGREPNPIYDLSEMDVQPIRTPSAMALAWQEAILWNGQFGAKGINVGTEENWTEDTPIETNKLGYEGLETQAIAGLKVHRMTINDNDYILNNYKPLFDFAFPTVDPSERYTREYAGLAIAAYERILLPNQAPWQQYLEGSYNALNDAEKRGAMLFFNEANCVSCHSGPALSSMEFHAIGVKDLFENVEATYGADETSDANLGRYSFTKNEADKYKFKVPQLYNLVDSEFFGHGSSFRSVREIIEYKNAGVKENSNVDDAQLASEFRPLNLTNAQIDDLTAFIENALRDPNLKRYEPIGILSGNCFPNNDPQSKDDLGCN